MIILNQPITWINIFLFTIALNCYRNGSNLKKELQVFKQIEGVFKGDIPKGALGNLAFLDKLPVVVCGVVDNVKVVVELSDSEVMYIYTDQNLGNGFFEFDHLAFYYLKSGRLILESSGKITKKINGAYAYASNEEFVLVNNQVYLDSNNCSRIFL